MVPVELESLLPKISCTGKLRECGQNMMDVYLGDLCTDNLTSIDDPYGSCGQMVGNLIVSPFFFERVCQDAGRISTLVESQDRSICEGSLFYVFVRLLASLGALFRK